MVVAVVNFVYVILLSSDFSAAWFDVIEVTAGFAITLLGLFELVIRFNPLRIPNFAPITRLNATFDGLALVGALVSCVGKCLLVEGTRIFHPFKTRGTDFARFCRDCTICGWVQICD